MKYRLTIPEPCHENWSAMTPQEKGRFCDKCQKCVVDFTTHSTNQLFQVLEKDKNICGRFRPDQLNRDLTASPIKKAFSFQWALSGFITFFGASQAIGQNEQSFPLGKIAPVEMNHLTPPPAPVQDSSKANDTIRIYGTVIDHLSGETIPFANIVCKELYILCTSDLDGKYSFYVPSIKLTENTMMHTTFLGYAESIVCIESTDQPQNISLALSTETLELVHIVGGLSYEEPTFWQRIGNWFARVF